MFAVLGLLPTKCPMTKYEIQVDGLEDLPELPGSWEAADYVAILTGCNRHSAV